MCVTSQSGEVDVGGFEAVRRPLTLTRGPLGLSKHTGRRHRFPLSSQITASKPPMPSLLPKARRQGGSLARPPLRNEHGRPSRVFQAARVGAPGGRLLPGVLLRELRTRALQNCRIAVIIFKASAVFPGSGKPASLAIKRRCYKSGRRQANYKLGILCY